MKHKRYESFFYDRNDLRYDVSIWQEVDSETPPAGWPSEIKLAADPVQIEWSEVGKLDPVQGSCATLRVVSMFDRQFFDMYSAEYGNIELRVYRTATNDGTLPTNILTIADNGVITAENPVASNVTVSAARYNANGVYIGRVSSTIASGATTAQLFKMETDTIADIQITPSADDTYRYVTSQSVLYWAGTLDPELFEEPYAYADHYITELSFVDLAPLEYAYWDGKGSMTVSEIIERCVSSAKFHREGAILPWISTQTTNKYNGVNLSPLECTISADNFYDDEDEPMTMREVLEETLRPFALRLVQKDGLLVLFDLHSFYDRPTTEISWHGSDATVEADVIYNDITVKLSPYQDDVVMEASIDPDEVLDPDEDGVVKSVYCGYSKQSYGFDNEQYIDGTVVQYTAFEAYAKMDAEYKNIKVKNGAWMYRVDPVYSGNKEALVMWCSSDSRPNKDYAGGTWPIWTFNAPVCALADNYKAMEPTSPLTPIIETKGVYVSSDDTKSLICVSLEALYDARYDWSVPANEYATGSPIADYNYTGNEEYIKNRGQICLIPVVITLRDEDGNIRYRYSNNKNRIIDQYSLYENVGWVEVGSENVYQKPAWLAYYNEEKGQGVMSSGWVKNKRLLRSNIVTIPNTIKNKNNGEYLPIPPESGYIVVEVCAGHQFMTFASDVITVLANSVPPTDPIFTEKPRTIAYKNIEVKIVPSYGSDEKDEKDIEDIAWINKTARENLEVSTIVGTPNEKMPAAKGALRAPSGQQIDSFSRGGHDARIERLLIGTAYSQYAERKNVLSGTTELVFGCSPLTDASIDGKYVVLSEVQNLEQSTSTLRVAEFVKDEYESIEDKDE